MGFNSAFKGLKFSAFLSKRYL